MTFRKQHQGGWNTHFNCERGVRVSLEYSLTESGSWKWMLLDGPWQCECRDLLIGNQLKIQNPWQENDRCFSCLDASLGLDPNNSPLYSRYCQSGRICSPPQADWAFRQLLPSRLPARCCVDGKAPLRKKSPSLLEAVCFYKWCWGTHLSHVRNWSLVISHKFTSKATIANAKTSQAAVGVSVESLWQGSMSSGLIHLHDPCGFPSPDTIGDCGSKVIVTSP